MSKRKTYRYKNLNFPVLGNTEVKFTIDFISNVNTSYTFIDIPGNNDPELDNEGSVSLGFGKDLRNERTIIVCDVDNLAPQEDNIAINFLLNNTIIVEHDKPKVEEPRPIIVLKINFPEP